MGAFCGKQAGGNSGKKSGNQKVEQASISKTKGAGEVSIKKEVKTEETEDDENDLFASGEEENNDGWGHRADSDGHPLLLHPYNVLVHHEFAGDRQTKHKYNHSSIVEFDNRLYMDELLAMISSKLPSEIKFGSPGTRRKSSQEPMPRLSVVWQETLANIADFELTDDRSLQQAVEMMIQRDWKDHLQAEWPEPVEKASRASGSQKRRISEVEDDEEDEEEEDVDEQSGSDGNETPGPQPKKKVKTKAATKPALKAASKSASKPATRLVPAPRQKTVSKSGRSKP